jgi:hypothetical protein
MTRHWIAKLAVSMLVATFAMIGGPGRASADSTCSSLLPGKFSYLSTYGGYYTLEITVTKDSLQYVTYSTGRVQLSGSYLYGGANLEFSDRYNGTQNFNINATENTRIWISQTGALWIYNDNYSYYIVSGTDMSCAGGLITKYVPGLGVVTVALRSWFPDIR